MISIKNSSKENEEKILNIIKKACRVPHLQPEDWKKYAHIVNNNI